MKKILALVLAMLMALSLVACDGGETGGTEAGGEKVVKIGVFEPLTGDNGAGGKQEVLGMQYANYVQPPSRSAARSTRSSSFPLTTVPRPKTAPRLRLS